LKPTASLSLTQTAQAVCCDVATFASLRLKPEGLVALRQKPPPQPGKPLSPGFLKHTDDQTLAALTAVHEATSRLVRSPCMTDWGVLAAPRFLGRTAMVTALEKFAAEGAWGVSPHLIPHRSLHSISGTISQALEIHGPNFGVGGGPNCASEAIRAAAALLELEKLPGVWLVLTGWDPEPIGASAAGSLCGAAALALVPSRPAWQGMTMRIAPAQPIESAFDDDQAESLFTLERLLVALSDARAPGISTWRLEGGGCLDLCGPKGALRRLAG